MKKKNKDRNKENIYRHLKIANTIFLVLLIIFITLLLLAPFIDGINYEEFLKSLIGCVFILLGLYIASFSFIFAYHIYLITKSKQNIEKYFMDENEENFNTLKIIIEERQNEKQKIAKEKEVSLHSDVLNDDKSVELTNNNEKR